MNTLSLFETALESGELESFKQVWETHQSDLSERQIQELLFGIVQDYYSDKRFSYFKKIFDRIRTRRVSLNFQMDEGAPTLLCIVIHHGSQQLLDYFLREGADINYIGDHYAFESPEKLAKAQPIEDFDRYETVLDYTERKLYDLFRLEYHYKVPEKKEDISLFDIDRKETITISKFEYYYLIEQAEYLQLLIRLDKLVDYIKGIGGKSSAECKLPTKN
jgi:hypothetical protein